MGNIPVSTIAGTASGAATAATSVAGAVAQNRAIGRSQDSVQQASVAERRQAMQQAALERMRRQRESQQVLGRLRVAAGEAGLDGSGSFEALERQADFDAALNQLIIQTNLGNTLRSITSSERAQQLQLESQRRNLILEAFMGGVQGVQTGLAIGTAFPSSPDGPSEPPPLEIKNKPKREDRERMNIIRS